MADWTISAAPAVLELGLELTKTDGSPPTPRKELSAAVRAPKNAKDRVASEPAAARRPHGGDQSRRTARQRLRRPELTVRRVPRRDRRQTTPAHSRRLDAYLDAELQTWLLVEHGRHPRHEGRRGRHVAVRQTRDVWV